MNRYMKNIKSLVESTQPVDNIVESMLNGDSRKNSLSEANSEKSLSATSARKFKTMIEDAEPLILAALKKVFPVSGLAIESIDTWKKITLAPVSPKAGSPESALFREYRINLDIHSNGKSLDPYVWIDWKY